MRSILSIDKLENIKMEMTRLSVDKLEVSETRWYKKMEIFGQTTNITFIYSGG